MNEPGTEPTAASISDGRSVVIFTDADGRNGVKALARLDEALLFVEKLYNHHRVRNARVFRLHELTIDLDAEPAGVQPISQVA